MRALVLQLNNNMERGNICVTRQKHVALVALLKKRKIAHVLAHLLFYKNEKNSAGR